jgi:hypothetical protein
MFNRCKSTDFSRWWGVGEKATHLIDHQQNWWSGFVAAAFTAAAFRMEAKTRTHKGYGYESI